MGHDWGVRDRDGIGTVFPVTSEEVYMGWREQQVHPKGLGAIEVSFCLCLGLSPCTPATPLHQPSLGSVLHLELCFFPRDPEGPGPLRHCHCSG